MFQAIIYILFLIFLIRIYYKILFYGQDGHAFESAVYYSLINAFLYMAYLFNDGVFEYCLIVVFTFIINFLSFIIANKFNINNRYLYFFIFIVLNIVIISLLFALIYGVLMFAIY